MYVDLTPEFRLVVSSLSSRAAEIGITVASKDKNRILGEKSGLRRQVEKIVKTVTSLSELLKEHRSRYLDNNLAFAGGGAMTETERNQVDAGADEVARQCRQLISQYREKLDELEQQQGEEAREHHEAVCQGLETFLKAVVGTHSEMRAVRVSRHLEMKKLSRLEVTSVESRAREIGQASHSVSQQELQEQAISAAALSSQPSSYWGESEGEEELGQEEAVMMELENERLLEHLNSLNNQVDQVQSKVVKIAELQTIFTEKVLQQAESVELVQADTIASTENVKSGNEAVRQAIQDKATYRVYILFIILVFSFSLLFLDWYNP